MITAPIPSVLRHADLRLQSDWVGVARADPGTRYVICKGTAHLVRREPTTSIAFLGNDNEAMGAIDASRFILLGWFHGERCVLVDLAAGPVADAAGDRVRGAAAAAAPAVSR